MPPKKKPKIKLTKVQWSSIAESVYMMGRERNPSKTEQFFAPMNLAAAALSHFGPQYRQHNIAIPLELTMYQKRFRDKDCLEKPEGFKCLQATMNVNGLLSNCVPNAPSGVRRRKKFLAFVVEVYDQYVQENTHKFFDISHPKGWIKYQTKEQFQSALKRVFSYCHHYTSYNPFHRSRLLAYEASISFFETHWGRFKSITNHLTDQAEDKFAAFKQYLQFEGVKRWYRIKLKSCQDTGVLTTKGSMGSFLLREEDHVLMLLQGYLIAHELEKYLPKGESFDYLSSFQQYLKAADAATKEEFAWLLDVELSEEFYEDELQPLHDLLMTEHGEQVKAKQAKQKKKEKAAAKKALGIRKAKHKLQNGLKQQQRLAARYKKRVNKLFKEWLASPWNEPERPVKAGEISWVGEGAMQICERRAHWGNDVVKRDPKYSTSRKRMMIEQLRVQHRYLFEIADGKRPIYGQRLKDWESWWTSFMNRDIDRYNNLLHDWEGKYKLDDSKYQGHPDHNQRQRLWQTLTKDPDGSDDIVMRGDAGKIFKAMNLNTLFCVRGLAEYMYRSGMLARGTSMNNLNLLDRQGDLSTKAIYVAVKLGFLRREWDIITNNYGSEERKHWRGIIFSSLLEWVPVFLLRVMDIVLRTLYEISLSHSPKVKRAIFDYLRVNYVGEWATDNPWPTRIVHMAGREIYNEFGELKTKTPPPRKDVPVSETYAAAAPEIAMDPLTEEEEEQLAEEITPKGILDYDICALWDPTGAKGLNAREDARSALLEYHGRRKNEAIIVARSLKRLWLKKKARSKWHWPYPIIKQAGSSTAKWKLDWDEFRELIPIPPKFKGDWDEFREGKYRFIYKEGGNFKVRPPLQMTQKTCYLCDSTSHTYQDCFKHIQTMDDLNAVDIGGVLLKRCLEKQVWCKFLSLSTLLKTTGFSCLDYVEFDWKLTGKSESAEIREPTVVEV